MRMHGLRLDWEREARRAPTSNLSNERPGPPKDRAFLLFPSTFLHLHRAVSLARYNRPRPGSQGQQFNATRTEPHTARHLPTRWLFNNPSRDVTRQRPGHGSQNMQAYLSGQRGALPTRKSRVRAPPPAPSFETKPLRVCPCTPFGATTGMVGRDVRGWAACSERTHTGACVLALGHSRSGRSMTSSPGRQLVCRGQKEEIRGFSSVWESVCLARRRSRVRSSHPPPSHKKDRMHQGRTARKTVTYRELKHCNAHGRLAERSKALVSKTRRVAIPSSRVRICAPSAR